MLLKSFVRAQKIVFLCAIAMIGSVACSASQPDEPDPITIGVLNLTPALDPVFDGFKEGMSDHGYIEGESVVYLYDGPTGDIEALEPAAQMLVDAEVDLILTLSTPATLAAKRVTEGTDVPVVFGTVTDPIGAGVVEDLSSPGGNITGITTGGPEPRRLELLQMMVPDIERVYIPYNPNDPSAVGALALVLDTADELGITIETYETPDQEGVMESIENMPEDIDAIMLLPDSVVVAQLSDFITASLDRSLPLSGVNPDHVALGALMSYGTVFNDVGKQTARLVDQIINGANPRDLPVENAEFFLSVNLKTADAIGLTLSDEVLTQAAEIIR
jgi:putative ABC transport system substrate-binding protein